MLESGLDISPLITHRLPWHAYEQGFAAMRAGEAGKIGWTGRHKSTSV